MIAIISDLHSNTVALDAVLSDAKSKGVERVVCLGDVIGYGPRPVECLDIARERFDVTILGNHEEAVLYGAVGFNPKAKAAIDWTRDQLMTEDDGPDLRNERWQFMGEMPESFDEDDGVTFLHGSPRDATREYVFPNDVLNPEKIREIMAGIGRICFNGHTHTPGILTEGGQFLIPQDTDTVYELTDEKVLVNVGSVGQPRDGDPRSCYVLFDGKKLIYRRVAYEIEDVVQQFSTIERLPEYLAMRLREGR